MGPACAFVETASWHRHMRIHSKHPKQSVFSFVSYPSITRNLHSRRVNFQRPRWCSAADQSNFAPERPASGEGGESDAIRSVNYFISRKCNFKCNFCFHTQKNHNILPLADAKRGIRLLHQAGTEKINFAGGEPFLYPELLGELCKTSHELGMAVSIISNGSMISNEWMQTYARFVDIMGVSIDSFNPKTNEAIGRVGGGNKNYEDQISVVRDLCSRHGVMFKMNTVVCSLNWQEDMRENVRKLDPMRWKVFQVLLLNDENAGGPGELRDARPLLVSDREYWSFIMRHSQLKQLIAEPNNVMQNSYILIDEEMRLMDCSGGGKVPSASILDVGVSTALGQIEFDKAMFDKRGGLYNWKRDRPVKS